MVINKTTGDVAWSRNRRTTKKKKERNSQKCFGYRRALPHTIISRILTTPKPNFQGAVSSIFSSSSSKSVGGSTSGKISGDFLLAGKGSLASNFRKPLILCGKSLGRYLSTSGICSAFNTKLQHAEQNKKLKVKMFHQATGSKFISTYYRFKASYRQADVSTRVEKKTSPPLFETLGLTKSVWLSWRIKVAHVWFRGGMPKGQSCHLKKDCQLRQV